MKVIIAGSRSIQDLSVVEEAIRFAGYDITEVVSGGAGGRRQPRRRVGAEESDSMQGLPCGRLPVEGQLGGRSEAKR